MILFMTIKWFKFIITYQESGIFHISSLHSLTWWYSSSLWELNRVNKLLLNPLFPLSPCRIDAIVPCSREKRNLLVDNFYRIHIMHVFFSAWCERRDEQQKKPYFGRLPMKENSLNWRAKMRLPLSDFFSRIYNTYFIGKHTIYTYAISKQ